MAQGARSADVFVTSSAKDIVCHRAAPGDRVAQASVHRPVLFQGRKVDVRVCRRLQRSLSWNPVPRVHARHFDQRRPSAVTAQQHENDKGCIC